MKKLTLEITLTDEEFEEIKKINRDYDFPYHNNIKQLDQNLLNNILSKNIETETKEDNLLFLKKVNDKKMTIGEYLELEIFFEQYLLDGTYTYSYEESCYLLADYDNELPETEYTIGETTENKFLNYLFDACIYQLEEHEDYTIEEFINEYK